MPRFVKGQSGNQKWRPRGIPDRRTALRELLAPHATELVTKVVELAKRGDRTALRLCLDRLMPPAREEPVRFALPEIKGAGDYAKAQGAIIAAVAAGELLPGQARDLAALVDLQRAAYETEVLSERVAALEQSVGR